MFVATLDAKDVKWAKVISHVEAKGKDLIKEDDVKRFQATLDTTGEALKKANKILYLNMSQYTIGDTYARVVSGDMEEAMEVYRSLNCKWNNYSITSLMGKRLKVNPAVA